MKRKEPVMLYEPDGTPHDLVERTEVDEQLVAHARAGTPYPYMVKVVHVQLLTPRGDPWVQQRSWLKRVNAKLLDKTVGGHVAHGAPFDITAALETKDELGVSVHLIHTAEELWSVKRRPDITENTAVIRWVGAQMMYMSERIIDLEGGEKLTVMQPLWVVVYFGYYRGAILFRDGEASGIQVMRLEELRRRIQERPQEFTGDMRFIAERYADQFIPLDDVQR